MNVPSTYIHLRGNESKEIGSCELPITFVMAVQVLLLKYDDIQI